MLSTHSNLVSHPPKPLTKEETGDFSKMYAALGASPLIMSAEFTTPMDSSDTSSVKVSFSQRDFNTNAFKSMVAIRSTQYNSNTFVSLSPAYESSTPTFSSPSRRFHATLTVSTKDSIKQTLIQIFHTSSQQLISQQYLDGYVLTSTPFSPPCWSGDEKHFMFAFMSNQAVKVLQTALSARISQANSIQDDDKDAGSKDDRDDKLGDKKDTKGDKIELKLIVEQALNEVFTDTRFHQHMDLGEQLNKIDYPYLLIYSLNNPISPITTVHTPTFYSTFMPSHFAFGPLVEHDKLAQNTTPHVDIEQSSTPDAEQIQLHAQNEQYYAPYPIIFTAQPIFPHRLGTIFYTSRPTRLFLSISHLLNTPIISATTLVSAQEMKALHHNDRPLRFNQPTTPLVFCLTPDAHAVGSPEVYTPLPEPQAARVQDDQDEKSLSTPDPTYVSNYVDFTYLEAQAYDPRWGMSRSLQNIVARNELIAQSSQQCLGDLSRDEQYELIEGYLAEKANTGPVYAELLSPHGTHQAVRLLRLSAQQYQSTISFLSNLTTYINVVGEMTKIEQAVKRVKKGEQKQFAKITFQGLSAQDVEYVKSIVNKLNELYRVSLPLWPTQTGLLSPQFIFNMLQGDQYSVKTSPINQFFDNAVESSLKALKLPINSLLVEHPSACSILPVNNYSYGALAFGDEIYRIDAQTIAFSSSMRDVSTVNIIKYFANEDKDKTGFSALLSIIVPQGVNPADFALLQLNHKGDWEKPMDSINDTKLTPLLDVETQPMKSILTVESDTTYGNIPHANYPQSLKTRLGKNKKVSQLPKLPVLTQFSQEKADGEFNEADQVIDSTNTLVHTALPSLSLLDVRVSSDVSKPQVKMLVELSASNIPRRIDLIDMPELNPNCEKNKKFIYKAIPEVYCPSMKFHTTPINTNPAADSDTSQIYSPVLLPVTNTVSVQRTQFSPLLQHAVESLNTLIVDHRPYCKYGQAQCIVTYLPSLYSPDPQFTLRGSSDNEQDTWAMKKNSKGDNALLPKTPLGVIHFVHGGPHSNFENIYDLATNFFALQGYLVIRVNYTGSPSYGEVALRSLLGYIGYVDLTDCIFSLDTVCRLFKIVSNNPLAIAQQTITNHKVLPIHWFGGSHSGYLGAFITVYRHYTSAVLRNAVLSLHATGATSDIFDWVYTCLGRLYQPYHFYFSDDEQSVQTSTAIINNNNNDANTNNDNKSEYTGGGCGGQLLQNLQHIMNFHSPMSYVHHIKTPTLLAIGNADRRVPCLQSNAYSKILNQSGVYSLVNMYPNAQHSLLDTVNIGAHSLCGSFSFFKQFERK